MQRLIVALAIGGALAYLAWRLWRQAVAARRPPTFSCASSAGGGNGAAMTSDGKKLMTLADGRLGKGPSGRLVARTTFIDSALLDSCSGEKGL